MTSFTKDDQVPWDKVKDRDKRYWVETSLKMEARKRIDDVKIHEDADLWWAE
jgi:hypothetical protein